ncbi:AAA domain-containing protein [Pseudomonas sp. KFB-139]|uniref:AAA domain-containing protein n=1 Tax=Pseudomonas serbiensis TaxID=3064350 RepID=A0ABT9CSC6_9PSED|nr:AAA domain-containing protein [Pseudomonas sp. KFB-138]MDO7928396.1 AAA domain-containing protein [Pseudomonas sp. KFB-138]
MDSVKENFLSLYEIDEHPLSSPHDLSGRPSIYSAEKNGELFLIKHWKRSKQIQDNEVEAIWLHELRQLHRLKGYPGAEDLIATLVEHGRDTNGFYLVLDAQERIPLSQILNNRILLRRPHWVKKLKQPSSRSIFWKNIIRISDAIDILHTQGLLHRQLDEEAILTSSTLHHDGRDFQLTGFEWSMRVPGLVNSSTEKIQNSSEKAIHSFSNDWKDLGKVISRILNIDYDKLNDARIPAREISEQSCLMLIEITFIRKLLGIIPFRPNSNFENLDGNFVKNTVIEIIDALEKNASRSSNPFKLALKISENPDAAKNKNSVTSKIQDIYKLKYGITLDKTNTTELKKFVEDDIRDSSQILKVSTPDKPEPTFYLKGSQLFYQLEAFKPDRYSDESTWEFAVCYHAHTDLPKRSNKNLKSLPLGSNKITIISIKESYQQYRDGKASEEENSWVSVFNKFENQETLKSLEQQDLINGFIACHLTEVAYARADIFPIEIIRAEADGENWLIHICSKFAEEVERLTKSLNLEPPATRLEKILKRDESELETLIWSLASGNVFGKEEEETILTFTDSYISEDGTTTYTFTSRTQLPYQPNYYIAPNSLQGTLRQLSRRTRALETLACHSELLDVLITPQKHATHLNPTLPNPELMQELDESKQSAFNKILSTLPLYLVQGPPGVGKTFLVSTLVKQQFEHEADSRLLLTAQSHSTVQHLYHEVCKSLKKEDDEEFIVIRCSKQDKNDETSIIDADEKSKNFLKKFMNSSIYLNSDSADIKSEVRQMFSGQIYKRYPLINQLLRCANMVFSTTNSEQVERMIHDRAQFDWTIMEETGKVTGLELISPLLLSHRRLMIGDHKQLPPYRSNEITAILSDPLKLKSILRDSEYILHPKVRGSIAKSFLDDMDFSNESITKIGRSASRYFMLFQSLVEDEILEKEFHKKRYGSENGRVAIGSMLEFQHRMHPDIAQLISRVFYKGKLKTNPDREKHYTESKEPLPFLFNESKKLSDSAPLTWIDMPDIQTTKHMKQTEQLPRWHNAEERNIISSILKLLTPNPDSKSPAKIAILSPYSEQVGRISRTIYTQGNLKTAFSHLVGFKPSDDHSDFCSTVDAFQGSEADIVIVSLVRNNGNATLRGALGFLADERRMNVLLSRARYKLIIVGSYSLLKAWGGDYNKYNSQDDLTNIKDFLPRLVANLEYLRKSGKLSLIKCSDITTSKATSPL